MDARGCGDSEGNLMLWGEQVSRLKTVSPVVIFADQETGGDRHLRLYHLGCSTAMVRWLSCHDVRELSGVFSRSVGLIFSRGNSWLAISQLNFASRFNHPNLKAIAPWEGLTDPYGQQSCRGGIPKPAFADLIIKGLAGMAFPTSRSSI